MVAFLLAACTLWLRPQLTDVGLSYGLHSYQQLAMELTDQGIPTQCDPTIRQRFALIRIPPAPWESIKPVLEAALDIEFTDAGNGTLTLRKDRQKSEVEDLLLKRFSRQFSDTVQNAVRDGYEAFRQMEATPVRRGATDIRSNIFEAIRSLPPGNPDRNALTVAVNLSQEIGRRYVYAELWDGIDLINLLKGSDPIALTSDQVVNGGTPDNPIGEIMPPPIRSFGVRLLDGQSSLAPIQVEQWRLDLRGLGLTKEMIAAIDMAEPGFGKGTTEVTPDVIGFEFGWDDLYHGIKGLEKYRNRAKSTSSWIATEAANLTLHPTKTVWTVSDLFNLWSKTARQPLVMEVLPARETFAEIPEPVITSMTAAGLIKGKAQEAILPRLFRSPWTVEDLGGVTIVRDELRFIDHVVPFNPAADISLFNARVKSSSGLNSPADLVNAAGQVTVDDQMAAFDHQPYGMLSEFPLACPYLQLIASDPASLKAFKAIRKGEELRFSISSFTSANRRKLEKSLREVAVRLPSQWSTALWPDFDQVLAQGTVIIQADVSEGDGYIRVKLQSPLVKSTKIGLCRANLTPVEL